MKHDGRGVLDAFDSGIERLPQKIKPYLPQGLRDGNLPLVVLLSLLLMSVMVALSFAYSGTYGRFLPLAYAAVIGLLLIAVVRGLPLSYAVQIAMGVGLIDMCVAAWSSGGIYTPRIAWLLLTPITPFFFFGPRAGLKWMLLVLAVLFCVLIMTWKGWLGGSVSLGLEHTGASLATYALVMVLVMVIPLIYHRRNERALDQVCAFQLELESKREEFEKIQKRRDQFIASVSHELRTPMNAILGFNELLLLRLQDRPEALKVLNHTRQSADHLMTVINDVLDYSQLQLGKVLMHPEVFDLQAAVRNAFDVLAPKAEAQQLVYRCDLDPELPHWVRTDRHRLVQVLVNLLGNALKFTSKGQVVLAVRSLPGGVEFEVQDTGIGIPINGQQAIFRRFTQVDSTIQQRYGGNGLGLAISRSLVKMLGGDMGFESREGVGSRFWFRLPLVSVLPSSSGPATTEENIKTKMTPWRFLVVDDHPVNRVLVNKVLKASWPHAQVREASNGVEALAALQLESADAVFMDMLMPQMDGINCTLQIRQSLLVEIQNVVIFGLTANVNQGDLARFQAAGLDGYMLKPVDWRKLCLEIERLILERARKLDAA